MKCCCTGSLLVHALWCNIIVFMSSGENCFVAAGCLHLLLRLSPLHFSLVQNIRLMFRWVFEKSFQVVFYAQFFILMLTFSHILESKKETGFFFPSLKSWKKWYEKLKCIILNGLWSVLVIRVDFNLSASRTSPMYHTSTIWMKMLFV